MHVREESAVEPVVSNVPMPHILPPRFGATRRRGKPKASPAEAENKLQDAATPPYKKDKTSSPNNGRPEMTDWRRHPEMTDQRKHHRR